MIINWDPTSAKYSANHEFVPGIMGLVHEMGHFYNYVTDSKSYLDRIKIGDKVYGLLEERNVITGIEAAVAKDMNYDVRTTHKGGIRYHAIDMFSKEVAGQ